MSAQPVILLVDDDRMDAELTMAALRAAELTCHIEVVHGGQAALDRLGARRQAVPQLVLLDLKMPGIDGFEVLRRVKAAPPLRRLPVVVLTSSREESDLVRSYDTGANSYLVKPASFEGFVELARRIRDYWLALNVAPPLAG